VGLTVGAVSAQAKRKHERARIDRMNPNLAVLIILPSFLVLSFFNLLDQFAKEFMIMGQKFFKGLRAEV